MNAKIYILASANTDDKEITCGLFDTLADAQAMMKKDFNAWLERFYDEEEITEEWEKKARTKGSNIYGTGAYLRMERTIYDGNTIATQCRERPREIWWDIKEKEISISVGTHTQGKETKL